MIEWRVLWKKKKEGESMELVDSREFLLGLEGDNQGRSCFIHPQTSHSPYPSKSRTSQMLYFGDHRVYEQHNGSSSSSSLNSPLSSSTTTTTNSNSKTSRKTERHEGQASEGNIANTSPTKSKKKKRERSPSMTTIKVRKDKLGDKITELQQLVSPFGKSDTASVLHEALGYIRFLHDQVQVLSSPYMKCLPSSARIEEERIGDDLRSRGLCLVPVSSTENVVSDNGADFWSPAISNYLSLSSKH